MSPVRAEAHAEDARSALTRRSARSYLRDPHRPKYACAHSGETGHPFRWQTDHLFRRKSITRSDANRSPCRSEATRDENHESRFPVWVDGRVRFRIECPFTSSL